MTLGIRDRIRAAYGVLVKGSTFPFNRLLPMDGAQSPQLDKPFEQSAWVMRAIKCISGPIASVDLEFGNMVAGKRTPIDDAALAEFWAAPAVGMTRSDFIEASVGWLKMAGEFFWLLDDTWLLPFQDVANRGKLIVARPDRMRPIRDTRTGELAGWEYTTQAGKRAHLLTEQVIQGKCWNPYDDLRGLPELTSVKTAAEADYLAGMFNRNLMGNNGDQGVYVIGKSGMPNDQQREQIVAQLRMKRAAAQRGQFHPVFLTGDIAIEDPKVQAPDANFVANRMENRHEIYIAFGVPASMADVMASYSIGSASDRYRLIEETCMPIGEKIAHSIEQVARRQTGMPLRAWFDWDDHSVSQTVRRERLAAAAQLWATGMPMEKISEYLGLELPEYEGWDIGYLPFSVAPVGAAEHTPAEDPAASPDFQEAEEPEPKPAEAIQEMFRALRAGSIDNGQLTIDNGGFQTRRPQREVALWKNHMAQRREVIKSYQSALGKVLMQARKETLAKLTIDNGQLTIGGTDHTSRTTPHARAAAADIMFNLPDFKASLLVNMRKVAAAALQKAGDQLYAELGKDDPYTMPPSEVLNFVKARENKLTDCADEIWQTVKGEVQAGLEAGDSIATIAGRVKGAFNIIESGRAKTISTTETASAYGQGRQEAMRSAGVQYKQWLTSGNDNVRPEHARANGQTVPIDEDFQVGDEPLSCPGDPKGSAGNVINCHCVSIAVEKPQEDPNS